MTYFFEVPEVTIEVVVDAVPHCRLGSRCFVLAIECSLTRPQGTIYSGLYPTYSRLATVRPSY